MRKILPLELAGKDKLNYDLYDESGNVLYNRGEELSPSLLMQLNFKQVFKREESDEITVPTRIKEGKEFTSAISEVATESLLKNTKEIVKKAFEGGEPDISVCEASRDIILDEVSDKIEKIDCIGQLRVFDEYTFSHTVNVSSMCSALGLTLGFSEQDLKDLALGALLHDIGKMLVPKNILNKPGRLTAEEFQEMKNHTTYGYNVIKNEMQLPDKIARVALEHQEKYSGIGYPNGYKNKEISLFAQVCSICDVYDALVSKRVYKDAMPSHDAIKILLSEGSKSFNPFMLYKFIYLANYKSSTELKISEEDKQGLS